MRVALAAALSLLIALAAVSPHVHTGVHGAETCAACVVSHADAARTETPDVAPRPIPAEDAPRAPGMPPVAGAPLGAIPGQSPPLHA